MFLEIKSKFKALERGHRTEVAFARSAGRRRNGAQGPSRPQEDGREIRVHRLSPGHRQYGMKNHTALMVWNWKAPAPSFPRSLHPNQISLITGFLSTEPTLHIKNLSRLGLRKPPPALRWSRNQLPISRQSARDAGVGLLETSLEGQPGAGSPPETRCVTLKTYASSCFLITALGSPQHTPHKQGTLSGLRT